MKAAVVHRFDKAPEYGEFGEPSVEAGEVLVKVRASALSRLAQAQAAGKHYSSGSALPFVPGVDGVGRLEDGQRVYFALPKAPFGAMAELVVVPRSQSVALPEDVDDVTAAAIANPGMSSWAALTERAKFVKGERVLINGATGVSGRLAIQIAKFLGAGRIVATGRNEANVQGLTALGADEVIALDQAPEKLSEVFQEELKEKGVDVILDYLWGPSAELLINAAAGHAGGEAEPRVRYVQIGSMAGGTIALQGGALRSSGLEIMGSGLGSVSNAGLVKAIGEMMRAVKPGGFLVDTEPVPLTQVSEAWGDTSSRRIVFTV
jgi:NADPH:quinone reductase-like Zn-dependent oxidoreductase